MLNVFKKEKKNIELLIILTNLMDFFNVKSNVVC